MAAVPDNNADCCVCARAMQVFVTIASVSTRRFRGATSQDGTEHAWRNTIWVGNTRAEAAQRFHVSALLLNLCLEVEHEQGGVGTPPTKDRLPSVSGFRRFQTSGWVLFPR